MDEVLKKQVEWVRDTGLGRKWCPVCENDEDSGHTTACALDAWIKADANSTPPQIQTTQPLSDLHAKQEVMRQLAKDPSVAVRKALARNEWLPPDVIDLLSKDTSKDVLCQLASNPIVPAKTLRVLAQTKSSSMRYSLYDNPNSPSDVIDLVFRQSTDRYDYSNHGNMIDHPNISDDTLKAISVKYKGNNTLGYSLNYIHLNAQRKLKGRKPQSALEKFKALPQYKRASKARYGNLLLDAAQMLANDKNVSVRAAIAEGIKPSANAVAPVQINAVVQYQGQATITVKPSELKIGDRFIGYEAKDGHIHPKQSSTHKTAKTLVVLSNPTKGDAMIVAWSSEIENEFSKKDDDDDLIPTLADEAKPLLESYGCIAEYGALGYDIQKLVEPSSPNELLTPNDIWRELVNAPSAAVREEVAKRAKNDQIEVLCQLARDPDEDVVLALFANRNTPLPVLEILAKHKSKDVRAKVANEDHCSPELWQLLARDREWEVRLAAAKSPKLAAVSSAETKTEDVPEQLDEVKSDAESTTPKPTQTALGSALLMGAGMIGGAMASAMFAQAPSVRVAEIEPIETIVESIQETASNVAQ